MYAEAVMNLSPWNVFETVPGTDKDSARTVPPDVVMNDNSKRAFAILSQALYPQAPLPLSIRAINQMGTQSNSRSHPLLLHLWIHLLESGPPEYVQAAERQADLLLSVATEPTGKKLGHLLHM